MLLLEENPCTCKTSQEKKVVLDLKSQKLVPTVMVPAPGSVHLASEALPAGTFDLQEM